MPNPSRKVDFMGTSDDVEATGDFEGAGVHIGPDGPVLVPEVQDTVAFYGSPLLAMRLGDGRIAAVLSRLCAALNLDMSGQLQRIRRKTALAEGLVAV